MTMPRVDRQTAQNLIGGGILATAFIMFLSGVGKELEHLQNFDGLSLIQALGRVLQSGSQLLMAGTGGAMLQKRRAERRSTDAKRGELTVDLTKVGKL